jgi:sugar phosphate isomerase/epimerase
MDKSINKASNMHDFAATVRSSPTTDLASTVRGALDVGFGKLGLAHPLYAPHWESIREFISTDSVASVELFLPYPRALRPGAPCPFVLGSLHPEMRRDAVRHGSETVRFADRVGIPFVRIQPFGVEGVSRSMWLAACHDPHKEERLAALEARRKLNAERQLDSFKSVLARLLDLADRYEVRLALTPGGAPSEMPNYAEMSACIQEFEGAPLVLWPDTLLAATGSEGTGTGGPDGWWDAFQGRMPGVTLRDLTPGLEPAPLGTGRLDWDTMLPMLEAAATWMVDPVRVTPAALEEERQFLLRLSQPPREESGGVLSP